MLVGFEDGGVVINQAFSAACSLFFQIGSLKLDLLQRKL
jgi:hypothetical protein